MSTKSYKGLNVKSVGASSSGDISILWHGNTRDSEGCQNKTPKIPGTSNSLDADTRNSVLIELLNAAGRADKNAFSHLYRLTSPKLYAVALRILKNEGSAQDCLQESFVSVWRNASSYQSDRAAPMTWLTTIVRNRAIDLLRKNPRDEISAKAEFELANACASNGDQIHRLAISECMVELKQSQRDCVLSAYYEGKTHPEIADQFQLPLGTVKTRIRQALQQLRKCLER